MPKIYARTTKISNAGGRSDYISNPKRQENIVLHSKENMLNSWNDYSAFESANKKSKTENNEAREIVIALPNELDKDPMKLKEICDDLSKDLLGNNRDFEYAVHWNENKTNLHLHLLFSERERIIDREPKTYKKDFWYDKETNKLAKANAPGAELRFKAGQVQVDKNTGEIKYNDEAFSIKDKRFTSKSFNQERDLIIQKTFAKYNFKLDIYDRDKHIAQKKLFKGATPGYIKYATGFNKEAQKYNNVFDKLETAIQLRNSIKPDIKKINADTSELKKLNKETGIKKAFSTIKRTDLESEIKITTERAFKTIEATDKMTNSKVPNRTLKERYNALIGYIKDTTKTLEVRYKQLMRVNSHEKFDDVNMQRRFEALRKEASKRVDLTERTETKKPIKTSIKDLQNKQSKLDQETQKNKKNVSRGRSR